MQGAQLANFVNGTISAKEKLDLLAAFISDIYQVIMLASYQPRFNPGDPLSVSIGHFKRAANARFYVYSIKQSS